MTSAASTWTLRLATTVYTPDHTVSVRMAPRWAVADDRFGVYRGDSAAWEFLLPRPASGERVEFKFVLDRRVWQDGPNLVVTPPPPGGDPLTFTAADPGEEGGGAPGGAVVFDPSTALPDAEAGVVSRTFFAPALDADRVWDVVVVGSGVGGGVLADALSDRGVQTLVLETGSYVFPTHIANLPRKHRVGQFDKHVWGLFNEPAFRRSLVTNAPDSAYVGACGYNLGGRSVFWGAFAPRMRAWEYDEPGSAWPPAVRDDLLRGGYVDRAEALLKVAPPRPSAFQEATKAHIAALLGPAYTVVDAPMAIQRQTSDRRTLSAGVFSTADLLMESAATPGAAGSANLAINLHQDVTRVQLPVPDAPGEPLTVHATDRLAFVDRTYRARAVVLAAGTLESAKIGALSGLPDGSGTLGQGLTDHPVWFTHFGVAPGAPLYADDASAKVLFYPTDAAAAGERWNALLELGADYNQGRYVDDDILAAHQRERDAGKPTQLCELVFLASAPLDEGGAVAPAADRPDGRPMRVRALPATRNVDALLTSAAAVQRRVLDSLRAAPLPGEPAGLPLQRAAVGGVAHEVGTMRMAADADGGVVGPDLRVHGTAGVYACDLSVFPSSPAANPTLTLAALATRLGDHLAARFGEKAG